MNKLFILISLFIANAAYAEELKCPNKFTKIMYEDAQICVSKDYWHEDGIRMPQNAVDAEDTAEENNSILPTKKLVDIIWNAADLKLSPSPKKPGKEMTSLNYAIEHNNTIESQINNRKYHLLAGHKKDVIQRNRNDRVTIYGWHYKNGNPIQPKSSVHSWDYKDYSHGTRLIFKTGLLGGKIVNINEIIKKYNL